MARRRSGLRGGRVHRSRGAASVPVPTVRVAVHRAAHRASGAGPPLGLGPRHPRHRLVVVSLDRSWADPGDRRARVGPDVGGDLDRQYLRGDLPRLRGGVLGPLEGSLAGPATTPGRPGRGRRQGRVPRGVPRGDQAIAGARLAGDPAPPASIGPARGRAVDPGRRRDAATRGHRRVLRLARAGPPGGRSAVADDGRLAPRVPAGDRVRRPGRRLAHRGLVPARTGHRCVARHPDVRGHAEHAQFQRPVPGAGPAS